jgi:hypothetical protein
MRLQLRYRTFQFERTNLANILIHELATGMVAGTGSGGVTPENFLKLQLLIGEFQRYLRLKYSDSFIKVS